jgi:hypothetical protein
MARIARAELHDVPFTDLLESFVAIVDSDVKWSSTREAAATLVRHSAHTVPSDRELLSVYATFCADYSSYAVAVTTDVFRGRVWWSLQTVNSSLPGLFNRRVYDAFRFQSARRERTRSQYLRYRLEIRKLGLSSDDRSLALLLSESWDGTMAELLATATSLTYDAHD